MTEQNASPYADTQQAEGQPAQNQSSQNQSSQNQGGEPEGASQETPVSQWHRVHPLSPLARFWVTILAFLLIFGRNIIEDVFSGERGVAELIDRMPELIAEMSVFTWVIFIGVLVLMIGGMVWSWWFTRYQVTENAVRVQEGALFRTDKQARLDRVQSIEITQPFYARLIGLAELRFEVAEAGDSTLHLRYLTKGSARDLRERLLGRRDRLRAAEKSTEASAEGSALIADGAAETREVPKDSAAGAEHAASPAPSSTGDPAAQERQARGNSPAVSGSSEAEGRELVRIPVGRAISALALSGLGITVAVVVLAGVGWFLLGTLLDLPSLNIALIPVLLSLVTGVWSRLNQSANFRVTVGSEGLRLRYGLSSTSSKTIPLGRIQAVGISQPLLWRFPGWFQVEINVAAGSGGEHGESTQRLMLPAGTGDELLRILPYVIENPSDAEFDGTRLRSALEGSGDQGDFITVPRQARWLDPLTYQRRGYTWTADSVWIRDGRLTRRLSVVPHARVQSARITAGPLERRLGLADVQLHSLGGPVKTTVPHLSREEARELIRAQAERAAQARRIGTAS